MEHATASVHDLIQFFFSEGDIILSGPMGPVLEEGAKRHVQIQQSRPAHYIAEYPVASEIEGEFVHLTVQGRIDGILPEESGLIIEEIKTTAFPVADIEEDTFPQHWAQAKIYGAMLVQQAASNPESIPFPLEYLDKDICLNLTYFNRISEEMNEIQQSFSAAELLEFFNLILEGYLEWVESIGQWHQIKARSLPEILFPFPSYRKGQELLCKETEEAIEKNEHLFIHAPTGIGKTVGVLFPAIKSLQKVPGRKIFYLTAKSSGKEIAESTLVLLREKGLRLKSLTLTAKSRICFIKDQFEGDSPPCDPEICIYAKGYFGKVKHALKAVFDIENLTREVIEEYAEEYQVCPFELSLDASLAVDIIICDYNYVFDPRVRLIRYFQKRGNYLFLIDEVHNLVERGRDIFSATIRKHDALVLKRLLKDSNKPMSDLMGQLNSLCIALSKQIEGNAYFREYPSELKPILTDWIEMFEWAVKYKRHMPQEAFDFYYEAAAYKKILMQYDDSYRTLIKNRGRSFEITLKCIDPSKFLYKGIKLSKSSLMFSATLTPVKYHTNLISAGKGVVLELESPFPKEHRHIILDSSLSTYYKDRDRNSGYIARRLGAMAMARKGNYMAFFPSYAFLAQVEVYLRHEFGDRLRIETQTRGMGDNMRKEFIGLFDEENHTSLLVLSVMGGLFGEGIDLTGDKLKGAALIGVGLPQIGPDRDIIKQYFDELTGSGFDYAYTYPGFCKVLQAAGRVIRTEEDTGVILYIGTRFARAQYLDLFPPHMYPDAIISSQDELISELHSFWERVDEETFH